MLDLLRGLAPYPQVSFDTSTIRQSQVLREAVGIVGPERILYGSDFPFFMDEKGTEDIMEQQIRHVLDAKLTAEPGGNDLFQEFLPADNTWRIEPCVGKEKRYGTFYKRTYL